ncbi:MAG: peptide chain release factor N(5)-glutamine methyltransferase [Cyclobacteriaceae bacterium]|nr:peptide chain release factor N(5)-glutamine methyltransferase [Cyclobacteriaceae bacterium]UYN87178.1 MAG: peptide chain release factor N(5)-glutamine methyltransferase [Cyclobacteriaceae bacterium]
MNSKKLFSELVLQIDLDERVDEINQLVLMAMEFVFGFTPTESLMGKEIAITREQQEQLNGIITRINQHEPIQYITGYAYFYNRKFSVNPQVLIPRPETEELVQHVIQSLEGQGHGLKILDIGTGSGCIPVTLKCELPSAQVFATDVSPDALAVANINAVTLNAPVSFLQHNILKEGIPWNNLDSIVSNPPYITRSEIQLMQENVLRYEPHLALFTPDHDPLIFYKAIAAQGKRALKPGGKVWVEINAQLGKNTAFVFEAEGYLNVTVVKDLNSKDRFITATHNPA